LTIIKSCITATLTIVYSVGSLTINITIDNELLVKFTYDPLGHRINKSFNGRITKLGMGWNVILNEWVELFEDVSE